ncbi:hypothetical protein AQ490_25000 [Wenjunlia vitaminophila]|uniref:ATP-grasp-modified RiPP n=2 Tax=Wenjunlia vitaminophila TaxID=76728 RepID=A0A0T6LRT7_WENVI|nr:hypothetical protein AQ490_25000 [Wenjunlia vitaminophila]
MPYSSASLDPATQTTVYRDITGEVVHLGRHSKTSPATETQEATGGGDSNSPGGGGAPDQRPVVRADEDEA